MTRVEWLLRYIHRMDHRAVVAFGDCRMCDQVRKAMEQRNG